jgi:hypothetical protein
MVIILNREVFLDKYVKIAEIVSYKKKEKGIEEIQSL